MAGVLTQEQFPCVPGNLPWTLADIAGPSSYAVVVTGTPPTGGQAVSLGQLGFPVRVLWACAGMSDNGQYGVRVMLDPFNALTGSQTGLRLQWFTLSTGAEVSALTDLSARTVRIMAMGR